ncbi:hypothetical protein [Bacillus cytotoxicus]|uniref:hypothetical protein n=1 Tax=Bacillus cytotoxicus TaxID=580165 RepID=UPI000A54033D|nr:hypothetical protein [Bacillus cytotoxicus]MDH2890427.1 hypothetical protein [Bacillus cytotoxicus]
MINLFSKWILVIYRRIWGETPFLIKLYFKATHVYDKKEQIDLRNQSVLFLS